MTKDRRKEAARKAARTREANKEALRIATENIITPDEATLGMELLNMHPLQGVDRKVIGASLETKLMRIARGG